MHTDYGSCQWEQCARFYEYGRADARESLVLEEYRKELVRVGGAVSYEFSEEWDLLPLLVEDGTWVGMGVQLHPLRWSQGAVAFSLCTTAHPLYTRFANIFGASISETTIRPNPRLRILPHGDGPCNADEATGACEKGHAARGLAPALPPT
jgi:hypothetical protein